MSGWKAHGARDVGGDDPGKGSSELREGGREGGRERGRDGKRDSIESGQGGREGGREGGVRTKPAAERLVTS